MPPKVAHEKFDSSHLPVESRMNTTLRPGLASHGRVLRMSSIERLATQQLEAYNRTGFYVFEDVVSLQKFDWGCGGGPPQKRSARIEGSRSALF